MIAGSDWIQTYLGNRVYPLEPERNGCFAIQDIAHALSMICRFNGAVRRFYSVAEHSVLMTALLPPELALYGLLHDAAEAYLCDLPRPVKQCLPGYREVEERLLAAILRWFGLEERLPEAVKDLDRRLTYSEGLDLMPGGIVGWGWRAPPVGVRFECLAPEVAEGRYMVAWSRETVRRRNRCEV